MHFGLMVVCSTLHQLVKCPLLSEQSGLWGYPLHNPFKVWYLTDIFRLCTEAHIFHEIK